MIKLIGLASLIFLIGITSAESSMLFFNVVGWLCYALSMVCICLAGYNFLRQKPVVTISLEKGIMDNRILKTPVLVKDIEHLNYVNRRNQEFLEVIGQRNFDLKIFKNWYSKLAFNRKNLVDKFYINLSATKQEKSKIEEFIKEVNGNVG